MTTELERPSTAFLAALEEAGAVIDKGLFLPPDLSYERYESLCVMLGTLHHLNGWLIGDALNFGADAYAEDKYVQAATLFGLSEQTLMNYASIARRIPPGKGSRRRLNVSFSIHGEVASLPPPDQKRWLETAAQEKLTKAEVRSRIKVERGTAEPLHQERCPTCHRPL